MNGNRYNKYNKITDKIYMIGHHTTLNFTTVLSSQDLSKRRVPFYKEFRYKDNKFVNEDSLCTIKRNFDYYLSIDYSDSKTKDKVFIMIRPENIMLFRFMFNKATEWVSKGFIEKDGKLYVAQHDPLVINDLPMDKFITLSPCVIENNRGLERGIRMLLNGNLAVDMTINKFYGLVYQFDCINMYQAASQMLAFLGMPEPGTNSINFDPRVTNYDEVTNVDNMVDEGDCRSRVKIPDGSKKKRSVFDKLDGL